MSVNGNPLFRCPFTIRVPCCPFPWLKGANAHNVFALYPRVYPCRTVTLSRLPKPVSVRINATLQMPGPAINEALCMINLLDRWPSLKWNVSMHSLRI
jgi:hypothetical protein